MDYNRNECQSVIANSEDNLFNLRSNTGIGFFEAICLRGWYPTKSLNLYSYQNVHISLPLIALFLILFVYKAMASDSY